jgi:hypothetical protein
MVTIQPPKVMKFISQPLKLEMVTSKIWLVLIVHESKHIELSKLSLDSEEEECVCYLYELEFLIKLKDVDLFLIDNIQSKLNYYNCEKYLK